MSETFTLVTDGACSGNGTDAARGGWAAILTAPDGAETVLTGGEYPTTNNRMELMGALEGLRAAPEGSDVELVTDSSYLANAISKGWLAGWQRKGWRTAEQAAGGQPRPVGAHDPGAGPPPQRAPGAGARPRRPRGQRARGSPRPGRRQGRGAPAGGPSPPPAARPSGATATRSSSASTSEPPRTLVVGPGRDRGVRRGSPRDRGLAGPGAGARRDPPDPARAPPARHRRRRGAPRRGCGWWRTRARRRRWRSPWCARRASTPPRPRGRCAPALAPGAVVLSLQNGVDNPAVIARECPEAAVGGVAVYLGCQRVAPDHVVRRSSRDPATGRPRDLLAGGGAGARGRGAGRRRGRDRRAGAGGRRPRGRPVDQARRQRGAEHRHGPRPRPRGRRLRRAARGGADAEPGRGGGGRRARRRACRWRPTPPGPTSPTPAGACRRPGGSSTLFDLESGRRLEREALIGTVVREGGAPGGGRAGQPGLRRPAAPAGPGAAARALVGGPHGEGDAHLALPLGARRRPP